jgi:hypothetical protein
VIEIMTETYVRHGVINLILSISSPMFRQKPRALLVRPRGHTEVHIADRESVGGHGGGKYAGRPRASHRGLILTLPDIFKALAPELIGAWAKGFEVPAVVWEQALLIAEIGGLVMRPHQVVKGVCVNSDVTCPKAGLRGEGVHLELVLFKVSRKRNGSELIWSDAFTNSRLQCFPRSKRPRVEKAAH